MIAKRCKALYKTMRKFSMEGKRMLNDTTQPAVTLADFEHALSIQEVADSLSLHYMTVSRWLHNGQLKGYKVGRKWHVLPVDLDAFLNNAGNAH